MHSPSSSQIFPRPFGEYQLVQMLGSGAMGYVFKAWHAQRAQHYAIKIPRDLAPEDMPGYLRRFRNEAELAMGVQHPHVIAVYEVTTDGQRHGLVMEFVHGRTLDDLLHERPLFEPRHALRITIQVAAALGAIHAKGIVHRDIKPSNLIVDSGGQAKIMDFGIARMRSKEREATHTNLGDGIAGTPNYISPEQLRGERSDHRADLYSLGVTAYKMLAGRLPFEARTKGDLFCKIMRGPVAPIRMFNPAVPECVDDIVLKTMARAPDDRFSSADELIRAFMSLRV